MFTNRRHIRTVIRGLKTVVYVYLMGNCVCKIFSSVYAVTTTKRAQTSVRPYKYSVMQYISKYYKTVFIERLLKNMKILTSSLIVKSISSYTRVYRHLPGTRDNNAINQTPNTISTTLSLNIARYLIRFFFRRRQRQ